MKISFGHATPWALLVVMLVMPPGGHANAQASSATTEPISVSDVINRIKHYARLSPENAELVLDSVDASNDPAVRLELALLLSYGPQSIRDRMRGLRAFEALVRDNESHLVPVETIRLIEVLIIHLRENVSLKADLDEALIRLEREQQARKAVEEKLEALRKIEQELEAIKAQSADGEDDGKKRQE